MGKNGKSKKSKHIALIKKVVASELEEVIETQHIDCINRATNLTITNDIDVMGISNNPGLTAGQCFEENPLQQLQPTFLSPNEPVTPAFGGRKGISVLCKSYKYAIEVVAPYYNDPAPTSADTKQIGLTPWVDARFRFLIIKDTRAELPIPAATVLAGVIADIYVNTNSQPLGLGGYGAGLPNLLSYENKRYKIVHQQEFRLNGNGMGAPSRKRLEGNYKVDKKIVYDYNTGGTATAPPHTNYYFYLITDWDPAIHQANSRYLPPHMDFANLRMYYQDA